VSKRLLVYCEGRTEEMFVERILLNHLAHHGVEVLRPRLCATTFDPAGQRGGFVNWEAIEFDLKETFAEDADPNLQFTTLLDVYRMPPKVLSLAGFTSPVTSPADVTKIEEAMEGAFGEPRFKAYLQRHEFEALLLADLDILESMFSRDKAGLQILRAEIAGFAYAEDINHGPTTHPAARLAKAIAGYEDLKASNAYFILKDGLDPIRPKCPRFDEWLKRWEAWGNS